MTKVVWWRKAFHFRVQPTMFETSWWQESREAGHISSVSKQKMMNTCTYFLLFIYSGTTAHGTCAVHTQSGSSHLNLINLIRWSLINMQTCRGIHFHGNSKPNNQDWPSQQPSYNAVDGAPSLLIMVGRILVMRCPWSNTWIPQRYYHYMAKWAL